MGGREGTLLCAAAAGQLQIYLLKREDRHKYMTSVFVSHASSPCCRMRLSVDLVRGETMARSLTVIFFISSVVCMIFK